MNMTFEEVRQHAISTTTLTSVVMSQVEGMTIYAPIAASIAFLFAATGYTSFMKAAEGVVDALENAEVIDEELADDIEAVIDTVENVMEDDSE
jgi:hypothetical protein